MLFPSNSAKQNSGLAKKPGLSLQSFQFEVVTINLQGSIINRSNREAKYFVEGLGNNVTLEMVEIPPGTFTTCRKRELESCSRIL
ncbi:MULTISPECIES: hypothetical protein [Nostoc]|uniref:Uncharacterized protein n=1 Tax=Nostoc paludosum FACHB-159 TaxID=2692908 RepID=A0ABR8KJ47_9NOSO|nr:MULTISPECIES: hypothetical protein [Nostoc]MBD2681718.1 hypothetical protein [Nostoc sp. FACHB-857]MBD2738127.1 hypothetical protein [Nostoc paludosum FACHB-159]